MLALELQTLPSQELLVAGISVERSFFSRTRSHSSVGALLSLVDVLTSRPSKTS